MAEKSDGGPPWRSMDKEEMTRHQALFYSQAPIEGLLPGEKARELFLRSQLPLPILSQIWNLVDNPHDNMLDVREFLLAMHLLQSYLRGRKLPQTLPPALCLPPLEEVHPPSISVREMLAYGQLFEVLDTTHMSFMDAITARDVLVTSGLSIEDLASVWNLADVDRDSKLSLDEFGIACHTVRYIKKGGVINGPINVQSLLPHRTLRHDLQTKKRRLADLQNRKLRLMALREKRKNQAILENKRAHLYRERLNGLREWHALVCEDESVSIETVLHLGDQLKEEEDNVTKIEAVAQRLNEDHGLVRGETARVIMHEQKLTQEIASLEEEADKQRKKRQRNSLIKDLDPFHQLHEERKEERMMGNKGKKKKGEKAPEHRVEIPQKIDPFDRSKIHHKALSGEELFGVKLESEEGELTPWGGPVDERLMDLTHGFEDDFVDVWAQAAQGKAPEDLLNAEENFFNCNLESEDTLFKTVPVTAEEDELWKSLSPDELALQNEQLRRLQLKLNSIQRHIEQLGPDKVIMENQLEESLTEPGTPGKRNPIGRRRISSDGTLECIGGATSPALLSTSLFTKRAYGDVYGRTKRLQEYSSRRTLSDSGKSLLGLTDDVKTEENSGNPTLDGELEAIEKDGTSLVVTVQSSSDKDTVKTLVEESEVVNSQQNKVDGEETRINEQPIEEGNSSIVRDPPVNLINAKLETVSENKDPELTPPQSVPTSSDVEIRDEEEKKEKGVADIKSSPPTSSESDAQTVIPCDTVESKVVDVEEDDKPSIHVTGEESQVKDEPEIQVEVSEEDRHLIGEGETTDEAALVVDEQIVIRRLNKLSPESEQHRSSLPPNFFSEHSSPVPPPRRNSPRKKVVKERAGSFQGGAATTGRTVPLQSQTPSKLESEKKPTAHEQLDVTRALYISTSPRVPIKGLHPSSSSSSPSNQNIENHISPRRTSPRRPAPAAPSPVSPPANPADPDGEWNLSISRSRPHSIACPEQTRSLLKEQLSSANSSPIAPPRSKRKSARKTRQSSAPGDIPSQTESNASSSEPKNDSVTNKDTLQSGEELSSEEQAEMEARQRLMELERMRNSLYGYNKSPSHNSSDTANDNTSPSNTVVLKLGDEEDLGQRAVVSPGSKHQNQVVIDVAKSDFSPQRASTTVNISSNQHSVNTPEFKSKIKLSFSEESDDFNSSFSKHVDVNKSANERLDSLIKEENKAYRTVVDLNGSISPKSPTPKGGSSPPASNGEQKSRIVLDLDDHQYRPQTRAAPVFSSVAADEEYMLQGKPALDNAKHVYKTDIFVTGHHHETSSSTYESASNNEESESSTNISSLAKSETELSGDSDISDDEGTFQATFEPGSQQPSVIDTRTMIKLDDDGDSGITLVSYHNRSYSDSFEDEKAPSPRKSTGVTLSLTPVSANVAKSSPPSDLEPEMSSAPRLIKMTRSDGQQVEPVVTTKLKMEARSSAIPKEEPERAQSPVDEPVISPVLDTPKAIPESPLRPDPMSFFEPEQTRPQSTPKTREIPRPVQLPPFPGSTGPSPFKLLEMQGIEFPGSGSPIENKSTSPYATSPRQSPSYGMRPDPMSYFDPEITHVVTSPRARELKRPAPPAPMNLDPPRRMSSPPGIRELKRPAPSPPGLDTSPVSPPVSGRSPDNRINTSPYSRTVPAYDSGLSNVAQTGTTVFHSEGLKSEGSEIPDDHLSGVTGERSKLSTTNHQQQQPRFVGQGREDEVDVEEEEVERGVDRWKERRDPSYLRLSGDTKTRTHTLSPSSITTTSGASFSSVSAPQNNSNPTTSSTPDLLVPSSAYTSTGIGSSTSRGTGAGGAGGVSSSTTPQDESMDPITGLRKTGPISAVDKAVHFVATTEPSFRVKKVDEGLEQVEGERATLIDSMRVRRRKLNTWVPGDEAPSDTEPTKSKSQMLYEERKKQVKMQSPDSNKSAPPDVIPTYAPLTQADIDARSINQESTKKLWEDQIATGEVAILPRPDNRKKSISTQDVADFRSEVESESLNLNDVKKQWELKAEEMAKEKDGRDRKMSSSKSYDCLSMGSLKTGGGGGVGGMISSSLSYDNINSVRHMSAGGGEGDVVDNSHMYESAIDREIRLAEERENELRREKEVRMSQPIGLKAVESVPKPATVMKTAPPITQHQPQPTKHIPHQTKELTQQQKESIIEKEIREQERREEQLRHEGKIPSPHHTNKEHEQSEYERQEKEQERISAHESIVEREIRLQREREQEIINLRSSVYHDTRPSVSEADQVDSVFAPLQDARVDTNGHSGFVEPVVKIQSQPPPPPPPAQQPQQVLSPTAQRTAPAMTTSISYEDAISTYAHSGESMIARELREQKEREEELRKRWREELGIESPLQHSEPDTPYNMPDPVQPRFIQQRSVIRSSSSELRGAANARAPQPPPENGLSNSSPGEGDAPPAQNQRKPSRVQPLPVEDDRDPYRYVPQYETPIEREIRMAREREAEFRQMKGLSLEQNVKSEQPVVLDMKADNTVNVRPQILHRKGDEPVQETATMKRLAHSRLQQEIEVERQREIDLQRLGHISTLSDDRKGDPSRYVDVVAQDSIPVTPTAAGLGSPAFPEEQQQPSTLNRKVSKSPSERPSQRSIGELKIEQELREMREREEELRSVRLATSHRMVLPGEKPTSNGSVVHSTTGATTTTNNNTQDHRPPPSRAATTAPGDTLSKGPRRKTNLAAEWEKKISGSS